MNGEVASQSSKLDESTLTELDKKMDSLYESGKYAEAAKLQPKINKLRSRLHDRRYKYLKHNRKPTTLCKRVIACLDVRSNDNGDLVVTKGDQYDVRENDENRKVRNLGKPVALARRYYKEGADEVTF
eukprot:TRINITY_DN13756_c0_g1_i1.p1 TRINITY_DN13756_c0_g1~~TRINITY_DN13756_c0_g1_i1.p1  ORF type:complete len:144 (-),score=35.94 TRINITY_DN13756_c0_g1_i1:39-422(-)